MSFFTKLISGNKFNLIPIINSKDELKIIIKSSFIFCIKYVKIKFPK